ncbi:FAD-binding oxidoreductase [Pseudalkalibacillus caeni]|uniref:FAD-binding oxidoreductase n=1 Tax=Exobacillus caeni TaxID=2574798 RepID=A0A5R9F1R3_9BACL|nr:FAD-binding oxidoreductase [Pseudalkalibacillus caeni]TLS35388.1 FAD-binding oxidoreductase [Pseudalkalibacillus caeni]
MIKDLEAKLGSRIITPDHEAYDEKRKVWNGAIDRKPYAIVVCDTEEDVAAAVKLATEKNLNIAIRGGGHHVAGTAVCDDGLMIDLSEMRKVEVDPEKKIAFVEGGATLADIDKATQNFELATPTGTVSETGVAGLALSGGMGYLRGKYGLTCDNIVGAHVVTSKGELLEVSETQHSDLFWAIRGGGGNFGIVTKFMFQLHKVGPAVLALDVMYDYKDAKAILLQAQEYLKQAPDEVSFNITAAELPPVPFLPEALHHKKVVMLTGMYAGEPEQGEKVIEQLRQMAEPLADHTGIIPYVELQSKLDAMVPDSVPVYGTSLYFKELDEKTIDAVLGKIDSAPAPTALVQLWALGGQMNKIPVDATPFAVRDASFILLVDMMAMGVDEKICEKWVESLYQGLLPYSHNKASYLNGIGLSENVTKTAYAVNYDRLVAVKKNYDPGNVFRFNHNIDPTK